jgi:hypothetical protein
MTERRAKSPESQECSLKTSNPHGNHHKMTPTSVDNPEFGQVFDALRSVLAKHESKFVVLHDGTDNYYLDTHTIAKNKHPSSLAASAS